jgi:hypothetical protein
MKIKNWRGVFLFFFLLLSSSSSSQPLLLIKSDDNNNENDDNGRKKTMSLEVIIITYLGSLDDRLQLSPEEKRRRDRRNPRIAVQRYAASPTHLQL